MIKKLILSLFIITSAYTNASEQAQFNFNSVLDSIGKLENKHDPKCYATASRLEDFIYGTPLSDSARFRKIELQKELILSIWQATTLLAEKKSLQTIDQQTIQEYLNSTFKTQQLANGDVTVQITGIEKPLLIKAHDIRQYGSIAYSLRAILAVQQDNLLSDEALYAFNEQAIEILKKFLDTQTLAALQLADIHARSNDLYEIDGVSLATEWRKTEHTTQQTAAPKSTQQVVDTKQYQLSSFALLKNIIENKVNSYQAYNEISNKVFLRNLQVYFARKPWPKQQDDGQAFKKIFTNIMIGFAADLYRGSETQAKTNKHPAIRVGDVRSFAEKFIPHRIDEYEDAHFFHQLDKQEQLYIESYDMDAFRDSGIHWRYLQWAIENEQSSLELPLDPFSAELITENVAQFGVLVLRVTGIIADQQKAEYLHPNQLEKSIAFIQSRIDKHNSNPVQNIKNTGLASSSNPSETQRDIFFDDITEQSNIKFTHRSSDWLSRLIRSYTKRSEHVGVLDIPPAFGGSGIAAEDINNDGLVDLLFLGGRGNKLYLNQGNNQFKDISKQAGINWLNEAGLAGEPRQPLIADFNNDGLQDILITYVNDKHRVYQNIDGLRFKDVTNESGLGGENLVGGPATVFDVDGDGLLDIYIAYFGDYIHGVSPTLARKNINGLPNKLFKNTGNFVFKDISQDSGTEHTGWGQAISHTDFDGDSKQDLIIGNDFGTNVYFRNLGNGKFEDITGNIGTDKPSFTMGIGIGDLNQDQLPDVYISNIVVMNKDEKYVMPNASTPAKFNPEKLANMRVVEANDFFLSSSSKNKLPNYKLSEAIGRGYSSTGWAWGADFFDADNDADDDLYVVNGMNEYAVYSSKVDVNAGGYPTEGETYMPVSTKEHNVLFINEQGKLNNASDKSGLNILGNSRSFTYADIDNDGDLDIALNNYHQDAYIFSNNTNLSKNNWLKVRLRGDTKKKVNTDAIGARLIATLPNGKTVWREIRGSGGYLTVNPKEQHFGMGLHTTLDLTVIWPNGDKQIYPNLQAKQRYTIKQSDEVAKK